MLIQAFHDLRMPFQNFSCLIRSGNSRPVVVIKGAAQNDSVAAREHISAAAKIIGDRLQTVNGLQQKTKNVCVAK